LSTDVFLLGFSGRIEQASVPGAGGNTLVLHAEESGWF
jgi:hypothetical protein